MIIHPKILTSQVLGTPNKLLFWIGRLYTTGWEDCAGDGNTSTNKGLKLMGLLPLA